MGGDACSELYAFSLFPIQLIDVSVHTAAHPELLHLQKELLKRRDKRLELASRKRSYEVANAVTRRLADESNTWSWWQVISKIHPLKLADKLTYILVLER